MAPPAKSAPNWDRLFETAVGQDGHFTTSQASDAGYSSQLLLKYLRNGRIARVRRSVYRIVHFPAGDHEDLATIWLWAERAGLFSHETALMLHNLSDALPRKVHLTVPPDWESRRLRVPQGVLLHYADVSEDQRVEVGAIPVTSVARTIRDCMAVHVSPELVDAAVRQASVRGLVSKSEARILRAKQRAV